MAKLPVELYRHIVEEISDTPTLYSLLLVNRGFKAEAQRLIYRTIDSNEANESLLQTLANKSELAHHVQAISINIDQRYTSLVADGLRQMKALTSLTLTGSLSSLHFINQAPPEIDREPLNTEFSFQLVSLCLRDLYCDEGIAPLLRTCTPGLKILSVSHLVIPYAKILPLLPNLSSLQVLKIGVRTLAPLGSLLKGYNLQLRAFHCKGLLWEDEQNHWLLTQTDTLEALCISVKPQHWRSLERALCQFPKLKVLKIFSSSSLDLSNAAAGWEFQLYFFKHNDFRWNDNLVNFLSKQVEIRRVDNIRSMIPANNIRHPQLLIARARALGIRPIIPWSPNIQQLELTGIYRGIDWNDILPSLTHVRSLVLEGNIRDSTLLTFANHMPQLRYLGINDNHLDVSYLLHYFRTLERSVILLQNHQLLSGISPLRQLELLHLTYQFFDSNETVETLFDTKQSLQKICILGITDDPKMLTISRIRDQLVRKTIIQVGSKKFLWSECKNPRWVQNAQIAP